MRLFRQGRAAMSALSSICLTLALSISAFASSPLPPALNITRAEDEAVSMLKAYLQIDTSNPPGNETKGALYLARILNDNGLAARIIEVSPGRSCVYARLSGNGKKKAVVLLNHIDVVPARVEDWKHPPFCGQEFDGEIWGRGVIDMKGTGIAQLEALLMLKRSGKVLDRDVIFLATPDEEMSGKVGAGWFVKNHADLVKDAEFLFNEGAFIDTADDGKPLYCGVGVSEKSVLWLSLTTKGDAGHASMPLPDSAINRLARALNKIIVNPPEATVLPSVREYFTHISPTVDEPWRQAFANIEESVKKPDIYQNILQDKFKSSMLRNTIAPTVLKAGYKTNVIPGEAYAELDCRLLPDVTEQNFLNKIKETINDGSVQIDVLQRMHADASPYETECFSAISKVISGIMPGVPVVPMIMPWFTDSHWFRDLGICSYGIFPFRIDQNHLATMHGKDERLPVANFKEGTRIMYKILDELCTEKTH